MIGKSQLTLLKVLWGCMDELERNQFEAALFKPADDLSDKRALDSIWL